MSQQEFGIKLVKSLLAAPFNATTIEMVIPASDGIALYVNDPVKTVSNSDITGVNAGIEYCTKANTGDFLRGIVTSIKPSKEYENIVYRQANTQRVVRVCQDPFLLCYAVVNSPLSSTDVNRFVNIDTGTGVNSTGNSSIKLDYATISDVSGQFKIIKILQILDTYSIVECIIQKHELLLGMVVSSDIWQQVGGNLIPSSPGDNLNMGTGSVSAGDGHFTGKLTVDGLIDPTGLALTPQVAPPVATDGTIYYDSIGNQFLFRENGSWEYIGAATYTNPLPTTITSGGIPAGSTFFNTPKGFADYINATNYAYIRPTFAAFAITGVSTLEVGAKITGVQTFTWTISDPTHAAVNSVYIKDVTNNLTLISAHSVTSPATYDFTGYAGGGLEYDVPDSNTWQIQATDTGSPPVTFNRNYVVNWYWLLHYGTSTNTSLTETQIKALAGGILTPTTARTYSFAAGGYKYICINEDLPQPTSYKDSSTLLDVPFEAAVSVSVQNVNLITSNYNVYRSTNILGAAISIIVA